jgi:hypothetical protein
MNNLVTDNVVTDLWLLHQAGEASSDSQNLLSSYLAARPDLKSRLEASQGLPALQPMRLSPSVEMQALANAREQARNKMILIGLGLAGVGVISLLALGGAFFLVFSGF